MSKIIITLVLGIIVLLLIRYLYNTYFILNILLKYADLNKSVTDIDVSQIDNPNSTRYAYSVWIYVNTWSKNVDKKWIYQLKDKDKNVVGGLYLDRETSTLKFDIKSGATSYSHTITDNFPIQKWTNVIVNVDNNILDFYLDGKLILSKNYSKSSPAIVAFNTPNGNLGIGHSTVTSDTFLARLRRWNEPVDPQTAWSNYLLGTGLSPNTEYAVDLAITQNNVPRTQIKLY